MADERQNGDSGRQEPILSTALKGGLAAVGVGLVLSHQPWGRRTSRFLDRVVDTTKRTFGKGGTFEEIGKEVGDYTHRDTTKLWNSLKSNWNESINRVNEISLSSTSRGSNKSSLAAYMQDIETFRSRYQRELQFEWARARILKSDYVQNKITNSGFDENTQRRLQSFSSRILTSATKDLENLKLARSYKFNDQEQQIAQDIIQFTKKTWQDTMGNKGSAYTKATGGNDYAYLKELTDGIQATIDNAYTVESIEKNVGTVRGRSSWQKQMDKLSGRSMTFEEALNLLSNNKMKDTRIQAGKDANGHSITKSMRALMEDMKKRAIAKGGDSWERLRNVAVDESRLFMEGGEAFSKDKMSGVYRDVLSFARNTLPGQLFKIGDVDNALRTSTVQILGSNTRDPIFLAKLAKAGGDTDAFHIRIGQQVYEINKDGTGKQVFQNVNKVVSGKYGFFKAQLGAISGKDATKVSDNPIFRWLDVFQDRETYSGAYIKNKMGKMFGKNERQSRYYGMLAMDEEQQVAHDLAVAAVNTASGAGTKPSDLAIQTLEEYLDTAKNISNMFKTNVYPTDASTVRKILDNTNVTLDKDARLIYETLASNDTEAMLELAMNRRNFTSLGTDSSGRPISFLNHDLQKLMTSYRENPEATVSKIELVTNRSRLSYGTDIDNLLQSPMTNETLYFDDILRRELSKEALLRQGQTGYGGTNLDYSKIDELIDSSGLAPRELKELKKLAEYSKFQRETDIDRSLPGDDKYYEELVKRTKNVDRLLREGQGQDYERFRDTYETLLEDEISHFEGAVQPDMVGGGSFNDDLLMNRSASPLDIVKGLNDLIIHKDGSKLKDDLRNIYHGLTASRDDLEHFNLWTAIPFFSFKRLSDELNRWGLGFSTESMKSTGDLAMAFMTKRVIPIAVGATYLDFADDTSREVTGKGLWQAFTAGVADVDLAGRKVLSGLGMDKWLKQTKAVNPIWQYWGDRDEYQSYEERQKYYREGYTPVRKAAWWTWGGVSEARGGEIQYWAPNIVRRAASNAYDESMYDGYFDKWSHSWLPTPINPISPLIAWADPYWLERKHSEDRPYALSGPMFQEGTLWGSVLNPTVGLLLKPEKELHDDDYFFFGRMNNGIDIVSLLHNANLSIQERARNFTRTNYISIDGGEATSVSWNAYNAPTPDSSVLSVQNRGSIATIRTGVYGVYGAGGAGGYGIGSGGGGTQQGPGMFGAAPGGGFNQNISAGFNSFDEDASINQHILAEADNPTFAEGINYWLFGDGNAYAHNGDIVQNENGELGIYQNKSIHKPKGAYLTLKQEIEMDLVTKNGLQFERQTILDIMNTYDPRNMVKDLNKRIYEAGRERVDSPYSVDEEEGFTSGRKLAQFRPSNAMELLNNADTVSDLMNQGKGADLAESLGTTTRLIGGIYGYMGAEAVGLGVHNEKQIAQSSDMTSYTRAFWDLNLGGLGGAVSEIGRRFIPNYQRMNKVNPMMNTMPDWMPERFRYGDPFSLLPRGEMRLPGKGYETLNDLHPDQYGEYGAFDRMKILADIAPNSPEYRMWRDIAAKTVLDPELKEEMDEVKSRARQQGKKHDFYDYNVVGQDLQYENVIVSEILGYGKFRSGNRIFKIAGVSLQANADESMKDVLGRYINVGQEVTIATDVNDAYANNKDTQRSINAAVYVDGESIGQLMKESGDAVERKGDKSAAAKVGSLSPVQETIGYASEIIGHLDIPIISDQWLRIRSPYESYRAEQIYGTPYQSWSHPIDTFLLPAVERAIHERTVMSNLASAAIWNMLRDEQIAFKEFDFFGKRVKPPTITLGRDIRYALHMGHLLTDRAALVGYATSNILNPGDVKIGKPAGRLAEYAVSAAHVLTGGNSMLDMAGFGAYLGYHAARYFNREDRLTRGKWAAIGAGASMAYRLVTGKAGQEYIPDRVKRNWEMEEYWDRLTYIKYQGLYKEAARRALDEEGVDVEEANKRIQERERERDGSLKRLKYFKKILGEAYDGKTNSMKNHLLKLVNNRINELEEDEYIVEGGKYTQSALIYKRVAESTMQGLKEGASWSQIISALPQNDREYFMEFVAERDKDKREKILATVSPSLQRALRMSWGMKYDKPKSNSEFFKSHYLPDSDWEGWKPDTDLRDIEVKTLENEAMNLSDFGFYESQLRNPGAIASEPLPYNQENRDVNLSNALRKALRGRGLKNVEVDVVERNSMGPTDIVANIGTWAGVNHQRDIETAFAS